MPEWTYKKGADGYKKNSPYLNTDENTRNIHPILALVMPPVTSSKPNRHPKGKKNA